MDRELLIEIGVEELPAGWMPSLTRQLAERVEFRLKELRIAPGAPVESYSTPRRLTARVAKIAERQEDLDETVTGPPVSAAHTPSGDPTPAAAGFAKKHGVEFAQLTRVQTAKGEYLAVQKRHRGRSAVDTLPDLMTAVLRDLAFPKQMHWDAQLNDGRGELQFGRPIRWLLFLYGGRVVPFTIGRAANAAGSAVQDVESGAVTYGHRFLATSGRAGRSVKVRSFEEYHARLLEHFVILEHSERRDRIARELETKARKLGGRVLTREHASLVDEVADLVEFPGVVAGFYDPAFLALPHEVLATTLVHHQHYFPLHDDTGRLKEAFLAVVNTQPADERRIAKNAERVVAARLRDARFFWETDRKTRLESRLERLHTLQFHKKLGSYRDKAERIAKLARWIAEEALGRSEAAGHAAEAARLAKADLTTDMVFEFTELQGTMGGIYAREEGLPEQVWKAIYYQYLPIGVEADAPPSRQQLGAAAVTWAAVSLADKLDTVVGLFAAGEKPTGSRDPFALRRQAQGVIKILVDLESSTDVPAQPTIGDLLSKAREVLSLPVMAEDESNQLFTFFMDRLRHLMQVRDLQHEEIQAATGQIEKLRHVSPADLMDRARALASVRESDAFARISEAYKRANNIVDEAWGRMETSKRWRSRAELLTEPAERALRNGLDQLGVNIRRALDERQPQRALNAVAAIGPDLARFFDEVRVNVPEEHLREARLALLAEVRDRIAEIGDISVMARKRLGPADAQRT